jgi:site-specific DNA recombinase
MKCASCGLTYIGVSNVRPNGKRQFYYRCNGNQGARGLYAAPGQRCPSKGIKGDGLEEMVWRDVEQFLCQPSVVIERLRERLSGELSESSKIRDRLRRLRALLEAKSGERNKVVSIYRKGLLNDAELAQQLQDIDRESAGLNAQIEELELKLGGMDSNRLALDTTEGLLTRLRKRLDEPLTCNLKRQLLELLVGAIRIETIRTGKKPENVVTVAYRFPSAVETCTGTDSLRRSE